MKVRVECGPNDVIKRSCVLAVNRKAGELAEKQTLQASRFLNSLLVANLATPCLCRLLHGQILQDEAQKCRVKHIVFTHQPLTLFVNFLQLPLMPGMTG